MLTDRTKNKALRVKDFVIDHDIDIFTITETWLRHGNIDEIEMDMVMTGMDTKIR